VEFEVPKSMPMNFSVIYGGALELESGRPQ
jgi:hypothetical protein